MADAYALRAGDAPGVCFRSAAEMPPPGDLFAFLTIADLRCGAGRRAVASIVGKKGLRAVRERLPGVVAVTLIPRFNVLAIEPLPADEAQLSRDIGGLVESIRSRAPGPVELHMALRPGVADRIRERVRDHALATAQPAGRA